VMALAKQYANDERVQIGVTDVSGGVHTLQDVAKKRYDVTPKQLRDIAVEEFKMVASRKPYSGHRRRKRCPTGS